MKKALQEYRLKKVIETLIRLVTYGGLVFSYYWIEDKAKEQPEGKTIITIVCFPPTGFSLEVKRRFAIAEDGDYIELPIS